MRAVVLVVLAAGCAGDLVEPWELDHDRIVAVRATPPRIAAETTAQIDVLLAHAGAPTETRAPDELVVMSPASLATAVAGDTVTAPSETTLAAARDELGLEPSAPVPLLVAVTANGFSAIKTVWLGETADNPPLTGLLIAGAAPEDELELELPADTDVTLHVSADDNIDDITWLTSCGTMHDFDLSRAYLRVEPDDPQAGELALVFRDPRGGVSWRVWPVRAR